MGLARSTYYDAPRRAADDTALVEAMAAICDAFEAYGWRRVQAALRQQGWRVNHDFAVMGGFVYVAIILDAWSRRVVGYALSRSIDARLTVAALRAAIERRRPAPGLTHHTDRGSQPNTLARRIGRCWSSTGSSVRWADAATPTTVRAKPNDRATRPLPIYLVGVTGTTSRNYTISKSFLHWNDLKEIINHKLLSAYR